MFDFARSNTISTQTSNIYLNQITTILSVCRSVHATWSLLKSTQMSPTAFHPSHMSRVTGSDRSPWYQQRPPSGQTSPGHCLPLEHLPSQADECKTLACNISDLTSVSSHSCNDLRLPKSDAVQWFFDINIWKYNGTLYTKSWVKDVIQGFAQKAVKSLSCVVHIMQCVKLNTKMS